MPRLTVIHSEAVYKKDHNRYKADPGNYRSPEDFCLDCFEDIDTAKLARRNAISDDFAEEQVHGLAEEEGLLNDDHPDYSDDVYKCVQCGRRLTDEDNQPQGID
jgi:hypothetical protein